MRKMFALSLFMLATLSWSWAQQPGNAPPSSSGVGTAPNSQIPDAQHSAPGSSSQGAAQSGAPDATMGANQEITEGCLGGSNPNYTITDAGGTTYRLNIPPGADATPLAAHIGEPVAVMGKVNKGGASAGQVSSINATKIGRGTGKCPATGGSSGQQAPPKQ